MRIQYICEICGERDERKDYIEHCEAKGRPDLTLCPPMGLILVDAHGPGPKCGGVEWNDGKPCGSHLCGAGFAYVVQFAGVSDHCKHEFDVGVAIFRGNGGGDTFDFSGKARGGYDVFKMGMSKYYPEQGFRRWQDWPPAPLCPAFWRAVKAVREAGWVATTLVNGNAVPFLDELPAEAA
jgi:hypothetical protein